MNGLELSKKYYLEFGKPMLENEFSEYIDKVAIGLVGHGSECFGYDDNTSYDHDFEPGFSIWLNDDLYEKIGFKLFRAYSKLPKEYMGFKVKREGAFGSKYKGVHSIKEFYSYYLPNGEVPKTVDEWMNIEDFYLAEATNGEVFSDPSLDFSKIRNELLNNRPEDVRLKKLASNIFYMAQYGQYNYQRCLDHNEELAAAISLSKYSESVAKVVYLLNKKYAPYYKWIFKGMRELPILGYIEKDLNEIMKNPLSKDENIKRIEKIALLIEEELRKENLSDRTEEYIEPYAYCVLNRIKDNDLRNSDVMI